MSAPEAIAALTRLRGVLQTVTFPLPVAGAQAADAAADAVVKQLDDYILPRYENLQAPLLAVVGGSTGAGKSTLINSMLMANVSASSAIRPTTRRPLLLHHPSDAAWFDSPRILPAFARVRRDPDAPATPVESTSHEELEIRATTQLPEGLALLDAPDIDSVVERNRQLAHQLLAAADLWVFVTTAARYADAVPWNLLHEAARREVALGIVLNRVPQEVLADVAADLQSHLQQAGLGNAPLFTIPEEHLEEGRIADRYVAPLRVWLGDLAADAHARAEIARTTLRGAVGEALTRVEAVTAAVTAQADAASFLAGEVDRLSDEAVRSVVSATADGQLLRGEVLARWQEFVGTAEWFAKLQSGISRLRDRVGNFFRGKPAAAAPVEDAVESALVSLLTAEAREARANLEHAWQYDPGGKILAARARVVADDALEQRAEELVADWQRSVLDQVRTEGADKRSTARNLSTGINIVGVSLMMAIFATTGGVTGGEIATAGGTAAASQAVLVAVFGEDAARRMAGQARERLLTQVRELVSWYLAPYRAQVEGLTIPSADDLTRAVEAVRAAERSA